MRPATHAPATSTLHTHAVAAANTQTDARVRGKVKRLERLQTGARRRHAALEGEHTERGYKTPAQNLYDRRVALPCKSSQWLVSSCTVHTLQIARARIALAVAQPVDVGVVPTRGLSSSFRALGRVRADAIGSRLAEQLSICSVRLQRLLLLRDRRVFCPLLALACRDLTLDAIAVGAKGVLVSFEAAEASAALGFGVRGVARPARTKVSQRAQADATHPS